MADTGPRLRVLAVAWSTARRAAVLNDLGRVYRAGGEAMLVVLDRAEWEPVHRSITVLQVGPAERRRLLNLPAGLHPVVLPEALVFGALGFAAKVGSRILPGEHGQRAGRVRAGALRRQGRLSAPSQRWAAWSGRQPYADIRPWLLWRSMRQLHLERIDPATLDQVILTERDTWPIGWQLHRINPGIALRQGVDRDAVARFVAAREAQPGAG